MSEWPPANSSEGNTRESFKREAYNILEPIFSQYSLNDRNSVTMFFSAAYDLNNAFYPDLEPENTGFLENGVAENLPLAELYQKYPEATKAFCENFNINCDFSELDLPSKKELKENSTKEESEKVFSIENLKEFDEGVAIELKEKMAGMNENEFSQWMENIFLQENSYEIDQKYIDILVNFIMKKMEEEIEKENRYYSVINSFWWEKLFDLMNNLSLSEEVKSNRIEREQFETVSDKFFKSFVNLAEENPKSIMILIDLINQNAQIFRKDIWIKGMAELWVNEKLGKSFRNLAIHGLNYMFAFYDYKEVLMDSLDFKNTNNFFETSMLLEMIKDTALLGMEWGYSSGKTDKNLIEVLEKVVEKNKGSYLLNIRAKSTLEYIKSFGGFSENQKVISILERKLGDSNLPFPLAKDGMMGYYDLDDEILYIGNDGNLRPLTREDLLKSFNLNDKEKDSLYFDYKFFSRPEIFFQIEKDFGLDFPQYSLPEQVSFLQIIKKRTKEEMEPIKSFIKQFGENGFKTFLSLQSGGLEMGEKILSIAEKYEPEEAEAIFAKYAELVDAVEKVREVLEAEFENPDPNLIREISEKLLLKGKRLLEKFADAENEKVDQLLKKLNLIQAENVLLIEKYKSLKRDGIINSLEEMAEVSFESIDGKDLLSNQELREKLENIYRKNIENISEDYANSRLEKFENNLSKEGYSIRVLKSGEKILSFLATREFTEGEKKVVEISAFNANPEFGEASGALSILEDILLEYRERGFVIRADALIRNARAYIQNNNFVAYDVEYAPDAELVLIENDPNKNYDSQNREIYTRSRIKEMAEKNLSDDDGRIVYQTTRDNDKVPELLKDNYIITQALNEGKNIYYLLERVDDKF